MNITPELIGVLITALGGAAGMMAKATASVGNRIITNMDKKFENMAERLENMDTKFEAQYKALSQELHDFKFHAIQNYASQEQMQGMERNNSASHATLHSRADQMSERLVRVETVQAQCKGCQGKI